jgi:hypothetical protein
VANTDASLDKIDSYQIRLSLLSEMAVQIAELTGRLTLTTIFSEGRCSWETGLKIAEQLVKEGRLIPKGKNQWTTLGWIQKGVLVQVKGLGGVGQGNAVLARIWQGQWIGDCDCGGANGEDAHEERVVQVADCNQREPTNTGPAEDRLGDQCARDEEGEGEANVRCKWDEPRAKDVAAIDAQAAQTFGSRSAHVLHSHGLHHALAHVSRVARDADGDKRCYGED